MDAVQTIYVVMTADLPCLKNVRLVLETIGHLGYSDEKVKLILNRSNAFTGINVKNAESALKRRIDYQIVNEYRAAIGALNSGAPFMYTKSDSVLGRNMLEFVKEMDKDLTDHPTAGRPVGLVRPQSARSARGSGAVGAERGRREAREGPDKPELSRPA